MESSNPQKKENLKQLASFKLKRLEEFFSAFSFRSQQEAAAKKFFWWPVPFVCTEQQYVCTENSTLL